MRKLCYIMLSACLAMTSPFLRADETEGFLYDAFVPLDPEAQRAVAEIQDWLVGTQRADGSWPTSHGPNNAGVIGYAVLALMVTGDVPGEGRHARAIGLGVQFLLNAQRESGLIMGGDGSNAAMYQHAIATVTLAEVYGMTQNPRIREALIRAVNLIVNTQGPNGGWRYQPRRENGDTSATVMQIMALRGAMGAGIHVPQSTIDRALAFIRGAYSPSRQAFAYMDSGGAIAPGRTAASLVSLQSLGHHDDPIIPDIVEYLMEHITNFESPSGYFWYMHYYASIGLYHYGGDPWRTYYGRVRNYIIQTWMPDFPKKHRDVLSTAWVALVLGVPNRYLPIYQR